MTRRLVACLLSLLAASSLLAQAGPPHAHLEPLTDEATVGVGATPNHALVTPKVAVLGQKEFLVSWDVSYINYSGSQLVDWGAAISARKVSLAGQPVGPELPLEPFKRRSYQAFHSLAADASGRFGVLWQELDPPEPIVLRRFAADGSPLETKKLRPTEDLGFPFLEPRALVMDRSGRLAAAWPRFLVRSGFQEYQIWMQFFDSKGVPRGKSFEVPRRLNKVQPTLAVAGSKVVLAYRQKGVFFQLFDFEGRPLGHETAVVGGESFQDHPAVAANAQGRFVVVWSNRQGIQARIFDSSGRKITPVIQVSTRLRFSDDFPHVVMDAQGNFVVVWRGSEGNDLAQDVRVRLFDRDGVPQGTDLVVASGIERNFFSEDISSLALTDAGALLVAWQSALLEDEQFTPRIQARLYAVVRDDE